MVPDLTPGAVGMIKVGTRFIPGGVDPNAVVNPNINILL